MGVIKRIHHIKLLTKSFNSICDYISESLGFQVVGNYKQELALTSGHATFVVQPSTNQMSTKVDTVYDIALEVDSVESLIKKAIQYNVEILMPPKLIQHFNGSINIAKIRSCIGDVVHTLISGDLHSGWFLPQFSTIDLPLNDQFVKYFDHITFAVPRGSSNSIIDWYRDIFNMSRIKINSDDSTEDGFIVRHKNGGMRLKSFDYWKCAKVGIHNEEESCKFVIAEELNDNVPNQVGTFLKEHEGAGIQHIGLLVKDIVTAAGIFHHKGAEFLRPPKKYYDLMYKRLSVGDLNISLSELEKYGILIDSESSSEEEMYAKNKYLLQTFTPPIFDRDTFFLELIERKGAKGFGSGNIKALWEAVDCTLYDKKSEAE